VRLASVAHKVRGGIGSCHQLCRAKGCFRIARGGDGRPGDGNSTVPHHSAPTSTAEATTQQTNVSLEGHRDAQQPHHASNVIRIAGHPTTVLSARLQLAPHNKQHAAPLSTKQQPTTRGSAPCLPLSIPSIAQQGTAPQRTLVVRERRVPCRRNGHPPAPAELQRSPDRPPACAAAPLRCLHCRLHSSTCEHQLVLHIRHPAATPTPSSSTGSHDSSIH
jgi:hypothetical protein